MYWVFHANWISWQNEDLYAEIVECPWEPMQEPFWWGNIPIPDPRPKFDFLIHSQAPLLDNYVTGNEFSLYSEKLIRIMKECVVKFETFETNLFDKLTKEHLKQTHQVFRLLEMTSAIDENRSVYEDVEFVNGKFLKLRKLVLIDDFLKSDIMMTRLESKRDIVLIHDKLRKMLDKEAVTGCRYESIEDYNRMLSAPNQFLYFQNLKD